MDKRINKMDKETLEQFMAFRKRGYYLKSKRERAAMTAKSSSRVSLRKLSDIFLKKLLTNPESCVILKSQKR